MKPVLEEHYIHRDLGTAGSRQDIANADQLLETAAQNCAEPIIR
jgi:hypothetical protein